MTTVNPTTGDSWIVPRSFEDYLATQGAQRLAALERCEGCCEGPRVCWHLTANPNPMDYCEVCLRRMHATDREEENMVRAIIGGAVTAALEADASPVLIRVVVDDAIAADYDERHPRGER